VLYSTFGDKLNRIYGIGYSIIFILLSLIDSIVSPMEPELFNDTHYEAAVLSFSSSEEASYTTIVKATFRMVNGSWAESAEEQIPLTGADILCNDMQEMAICYESDFLPFKPRADALCVGKVYGPAGKAITECLIRFSVGPVNKTIRVFGNRYWEKNFDRIGSLVIGPKPFKSIDVSFENAYGGKDPNDPGGFMFYAFNPIGKGYTNKDSGLKGLALPNLEDPRQPIKHWQDRVVPKSFGPVGRTWMPRFQRAGTYDTRWLEHRSPELPEDFDEAYYNCAPVDQQIAGYLRGDEEVRIDNMHPEYPLFRCRLPGVRVRSFVDRKTQEKSQLEEIPMNLDTLWVDMEALTMVLVWRGRIPEAGLDSDLPVLIVEELLEAEPRPSESYREKLQEFQNEEQDTESEAEEAESEVAAMDRISEDGSSDIEIESQVS